jgi:alpha-1,6-mannosyltransferase
VILCLAVAAIAAHHASFLSPTATSQRYPSWMAGPLAGLWPAAVPNARTLEWIFSGALALMFAAYLLVLREAPRIQPGWMLAAILAVQLVFLLAPPLEYTDVFNYINYGRMGVVHHLDPYTVLPLREPHSDPAYALSNWHYLRSPYGPLFTLLTYALVPLGLAGSLWAIKAIVGICSLALLALVWRLAQLLGRSPTLAVAFVGLNPIVLIWGVGGEHNDVVMVLLVVAAIYLLLLPRLRGEPPERSQRTIGHGVLAGPELAAGALLIGAVGIKASAAIFLPLAIAIAGRRRSVLVGMGGAALVLILVSLLAFGPHLGGVRAQSTLVSPEGLPNLLGILLGLGGETAGLRAVLTGTAAVIILFAAARAWRRPLGAMEYGCVTALALIFTLGWSAPWYVLWALPFGALVASRRWRVLLLAYTLYALIASSPGAARIEHYLHFYPRADRLGREHVLQFDRLGAA